MAEPQVKGRILIVDDEASMREMLSILLTRDGYEVAVAENGESGLAQALSDQFDLIISDIQMPKLSGIEMLQGLREKGLDTPMVMITAFSSTEDAVKAMKLGAYDYITKPFNNDEIRLVIANALEHQQLKAENQQLKEQLGQRFSFHELIGDSPVMKNLIELLKRIAPSQANVLIMGESGTGKELVAKALHFNSPRKDHPFIAINCGAIPENLLESELFGHEKGAFTGADRRKTGLFEAANGGTLFLDEIGELPMSMQVKLLRVLQEREFRRVGSTKSWPLDIRLLSATNRDLTQAVQEGSFREDLFYRINVVQIDLPALRVRPVDIPLLINHFFQQRTGEPALPISKEALNCLLDYDWPGNIRELENFVERCVVLGWREQIESGDLPSGFSQNQKVRTVANWAELLGEDFDLDSYLAEIEREILLEALERSGGVRKKAAELLGISFRSIRYRLSKIGLEDGDNL